MGLRTAVGQSWYVAAFVLALVGWLVVKAGTVLATMGSLWTTPADGPWVGQVAASGVVGLAVMAVFVALLVGLFGELAETSPSPSTWPPEE
ncbi:hypothetical protein BRC93_03380 [Halobacteriales archaeon QS_5_70_15]|nr:MAG: hypothetical protein BRC93_03380 [Halobacteriales archaeon QS_5_70_15]